MPRRLRLEFPGAIYHLSARGNERKMIFRSERDRFRFLELLENARIRFGVVIHGFCLMPNHFHLVVQTPKANLSRMMAWFLTSYTVWFNRKNGRVGHLFQGRYKAFLVEEDTYAQRLLLYVHANPARTTTAKGLSKKERWKLLNDFPWSSHLDYAAKRKSALLHVETAWLRYWSETPQVAQKQYLQALLAQVTTKEDPPWNEVRGSIALGSATFVQKILALLSKKPSRPPLLWMMRHLDDETRSLVQNKIKIIADPRIRIWVRVAILGETQTAIARELGYKDGSTICHMLRRLSQAAKRDFSLDEQLRQWQQIASGFKV